MYKQKKMFMLRSTLYKQKKILTHLTRFVYKYYQIIVFKALLIDITN